MCGIVAYIGKRNGVPIAIEGLKQLEYRGYDSAGIAAWDGSRFHCIKTVGRVAALRSAVPEALSASVAIAHTRWATHGKPAHENAHPHQDCRGEVFVVHNGIIENFQEIKDALAREGHVFRSETDTEVIAHLVERNLLLEGKTVPLEDAVLESMRHIVGTFGIAVISRHDPDKIIAARRGSPLIVGVGEGEYIVASDPAAVVGVTKKVIYLHDNELAVITPARFEMMNIGKKPLIKEIQTIEWNLADAQKGGFEHFMQKEIFEGPETVKNSLRGRLLEDGSSKLGGLEDVKDRFLSSKNLVIVACGTSYYAGLLGKYYFEELAKIPTSVERASEFRYRDPIVDSETTAIFISQSSETADTLEALREAKKRGVLTLGVVNVVGSTIARESHAGVYNHAGPEIGVASTKAFLSQISVLMLMALFLQKRNGVAPHPFNIEIVHEFKALPAKMDRILKKDAEVKRLAEKYLAYGNFAYVGRKYNFPVALEGALKLKEISYRFAEGYAAGEMKHGPLALVDGNMPVVALATAGSVYEKTLSNLQEIKARDGRIIAIATEGDARIGSLADDVLLIPPSLEILTPILSVIPLQMFAYHTAALLGLDVDKPRNLAKSVTVE